MQTLRLFCVLLGIYEFLSHYSHVIDSGTVLNFWPDCKVIPAYGLMMSVHPSVCCSHFVNLYVLVLEFTLHQAILSLVVSCYPDSIFASCLVVLPF